MPRRPTVVVVAAGSPGPLVCAAHGGFDRWFREGLGDAAEVRVVECSGARAAAREADGVVLTGSYASVTERAPWMVELGEVLIHAAARIPVLGVCFGHQLLAAALGGVVERNPRGPEVGTREVELTEAGRADALLAGLPARLAVQQLHEDHVPAVPPGAVLLATGTHAPVQAFAAGPRLRAVQFHPEFTAARVRAMCDEERAWVDRGGPGLHAEAVAGLRETPEANGLLARWVERFVRAA
jgi:GMP synthase (glutamine-hydrolysing)